MINQDLNSNEKRKLLVELIELYLYCGYDITGVVGRSLSYFNYENIITRINELKIEKGLIDG